MDGNYNLSDIAAVMGANRNNDGLFGGESGSWFIIILFLFAFLGWGNNGGFGGGYGGGAAENYVLASDFATLQRQIDSGVQSLERKGDSISNGLCDGFYTQAQLVNGVNMNIANGFAQAELARTNGNTAIMQQLNNNAINAMQNQNALQTQIADCCCQNRYDSLQNANTTQRVIENGFANVGYNQATNACAINTHLSNSTRDIVDAQHDGTAAILAKLSAMEANAKDEKIAQLTADNQALKYAASQQCQNTTLINALRPAPVPAFPVNPPYQFNGCNSGCNC